MCVLLPPLAICQKCSLHTLQPSRSSPVHERRPSLLRLGKRHYFGPCPTGDPTVNSVYFRPTSVISSDPQRRRTWDTAVIRSSSGWLVLWSNINRARPITSIGLGDNVDIKVEMGATMLNVRAGGSGGTDLGTERLFHSGHPDSWLTWKFLWSAVWWGLNSKAG